MSTAVPPQTTRRGMLRLVGLSASTVAVAGAAGLTSRAVGGGVFSTGQGAAYDAWAAVGTGTGPVGLVRAAVLASNAHNAQPWIFDVSDQRIDLYADLDRTTGALDPAQREMHLSLGCALENLVLAGPGHGLRPEVTLLPDAEDPAHVASITLSPWSGASEPGVARLAEVMDRRHTDRNAYDTTRDVSAADFAALSEVVGVSDTELVWLRSAEQMGTFADLTVRATEEIIADHDQARDDFAWYRGSWSQTQDRQDGITIDPSGQSALIRALSKLVPTSQAQNDEGWLSGTRQIQLPTAAAFGALVVARPTDPGQRLRAGRTWQRLHLAATMLGLSLQPLCQIPERIDREATAGLTPALTTAAASLWPQARHPVLTFRIGHPTTESLLSPRRSAERVIRRQQVSS